MTRNWSWNDYDVIRNNYPIEGVKVTERFPGSTFETVRSRALKIGAGAPLPFTDREIELAKKYGSTLGSALIFLMPERTPVEIAELLK
ncbi:MAG: hypothetical protein NC489_30205 [Ruminococcus flavefaciens]|nr:hypothetical protein [Ruminococcus flavefaciens]